MYSGGEGGKVAGGEGGEERGKENKEQGNKGQGTKDKGQGNKETRKQGTRKRGKEWRKMREGDKGHTEPGLHRQYTKKYTLERKNIKKFSKCLHK
ncbi:MAG: hypothetical protein II970_03245 [Paludibacteraceae bacterium]|nr:hypothetical protein [Paludibacteraceae bacterium]